MFHNSFPAATSTFILPEVIVFTWGVGGMRTWHAKLLCLCSLNLTDMEYANSSIRPLDHWLLKVICFAEHMPLPSPPLPAPFCIYFTCINSGMSKRFLLDFQITSERFLFHFLAFFDINKQDRILVRLISNGSQPQPHLASKESLSNPRCLWQ